MDQETGGPGAPSTQQIVDAVCDLARVHGRPVTVTDEIGADRVSTAPLLTPGEVRWEDALVHESHLVVQGSPTIDIAVYQHDEVRVQVDGLAFEDVPRVAVTGLVAAVLNESAHLADGTLLRPGKVVVDVPGRGTFEHLLEQPGLSTPWLRRLPVR